MANLLGFVRENSDTFAAIVGVSLEFFEESGCTLERDLGPRLDALRVDVLTGDVTPIVSGWDMGETLLTAGMSADGRRAIIGPESDDDPAVVIDIDSGEVIQTLDFAFTNNVFTLSPDGTLATAPGPIGLALYEVETGALYLNLPPPQAETVIVGARWSEDSRQLLVSDITGTVTVYDVETASVFTTLASPGANVELIRITEDGQRVATVTADGPEEPDQHAARVSTMNGNEAGRFAPCSPSTGPFYLVDGVEVHEDLLTVFAICEAGRIGLANPPEAFTYSRETGERIARHQAIFQNIDVADGSLAAMQIWTGGGESIFAGELAITDLRTGEVVDVLAGVCGWEWQNGPDECASGSGTPIVNTEIAISPAADVVAIASEDGNTGLAWNRSSGVTAQLGRPESETDGAVFLVEVSGDGTRLAAAQEARIGDAVGTRLFLYSTDDFRLLAEVLHEDTALVKTGIRFSPDGSMLAGNAGESVVFFDATTLEQVAVLPDPHELEIRNIVNSNDGSMLATTGLDGFARVWSLDGLELLHEIDVGSLGFGVAFAAEDRQLAVLTRQEGLQLFHLDHHALVGEALDRIVRGFTEAECSVQFPDGGCPTLEALRQQEGAA